MNKKTGIMQGRLLPKYKNRYQAHPFGYWEDEFWIAQKPKKYQANKGWYDIAFCFQPR